MNGEKLSPAALIVKVGEIAGLHGVGRIDLMEDRVEGARCPRDGSELRRETVGGRTTYWCPKHQH